MKKGKLIGIIGSVVAVVGVMIGAYFYFLNQDNQTNETPKTKVSEKVTEKENQENNEQAKEENQNSENKVDNQSGDKGSTNTNTKANPSDPLAQYPEAKKFFEKAMNMPENAFSPWKDRDGESAYSYFILNNQEIRNWLQKNIFFAQNAIVAKRNGLINNEELKKRAEPLFKEYKQKLDEFRSLPAKSAAKEYQQNFADFLEAFYQVQYAKYQALLNDDESAYWAIYHNIDEKLMDKFNALQRFENTINR